MKILLVDDDKDMELLIRAKYKKDEIIVEKQPSRAINIIPKESPDLIILDLKFPDGESGFQLLEKLKKFEILIPVVVVSAYSDHQNMRHAIQLGAFDFISKPIDFKELDLTILRAQRYAFNITQSQQSYQIIQDLSKIDEVKLFDLIKQARHYIITNPQTNK